MMRNLLASLLWCLTNGSGPKVLLGSPTMLCPVHKTTLSRTLLGDALPMPLCRDFL